MTYSPDLLQKIEARRNKTHITNFEKKEQRREKSEEEKKDFAIFARSFYRHVQGGKIWTFNKTHIIW